MSCTVLMCIKGLFPLIFARNALKVIHFTCRVPQIEFPSGRLPKWKGGKLKTISFCAPHERCSVSFIISQIFLTHIFAPEPPVIAHVDSCPSTACDSSILTVEDNQYFVHNLCKVKRSFKPYQNDQHNAVKDTGEKGRKPYM